MRPGTICSVLVMAASLAVAGPAHAQIDRKIFDARLEAARLLLPSAPEDVLQRLDALDRAVDGMPAPQREEMRARILVMRADAHYRSGAFETARAEIAQVRRMIGESGPASAVRGNLLRVQGALQMQRGEPSAALSSYLAAFDVFKQIEDTRSQSVVLQWIASLYDKANDFERAEKYYREAAELPVSDDAMALSIHNNLGIVLFQSERYVASELEFRRALTLARKLKNRVYEARILANLALVQIDLGKTDAAATSVAEGARVVRVTPDAASLLPQINAVTAWVELAQGRLERAVQHMDQAFAGVDTTTTGAAFRDAHQAAYQIYSKHGDSAKALEHLAALYRLTEQATKVATSNSSALMAARFDYANQEAKIANLRAEEADRRAHFQQVLFLSIGAAVAVIVALLSFGIVTLRRSRNQVRAANADLAQSNVALEKALKAKTEFLATTSHEIRTPLNGILGMTQVMLADSTLPQSARDRIGVVHGAGVTMRALVDDILDVAKIETGNLTVDPAPMDLRATLTDVTRMWDEQARAKGLAFTLDLAGAPGWIVSDAGRLRQIAFNLLSNALKFTLKGGITVRVETAGEGDAGRLRIVIVDTGIGIPDDKRDVIFESFKQVDASTTRRFGGTGLGLTICRNLARALGGEILVDSIAGAGSTFTIDLPLVTADAPEQSEAAEQGSVLLVERNPIARSMLRTLFEQRGVRVGFASNFAEAEAALANDRFEQMLIEEATARAAADPPFASIAALIDTAHAAGTRVTLLWAQAEDPVRAQVDAVGADAVLEKPVAATVVVEKLFRGEKQNADGDASRPLVPHAA